MSSEVFRIVIYHLPFVIQAKAFKGAKCVSITIASSKINEVPRVILNSFIQKLHNHKKAQNAYKQTKIEKFS